MKHLLPKLSINFSEDYKRFFSKLELIASDFPNNDIQIKYDSNKSDIERLILKPLHLIQHHGLIGQIIKESKRKARISVNAKKWEKEPITHDEYIDTAEIIFKPIFHEYNKRFKKKG